MDNNTINKKLNIMKNLILKKYENDFIFELTNIIYDKLHMTFCLKDDIKNSFIKIIDVEENFKKIDEDFQKYKKDKIEKINNCHICFEDVNRIILPCENCSKSICFKCCIKLSKSYFDSVDTKVKKLIMKNRVYIYKCPFCRGMIEADKNALVAYNFCINKSQEK